MGRSQRHKKFLQGKVSADLQDAKAKVGDYSGSRMRAGATGGTADRGRAGGALSSNSVMGAGYLSGGYAGTRANGGASATTSGGVTEPLTPYEGGVPF